MITCDQSAASTSACDSPLFARLWLMTGPWSIRGAARVFLHHYGWESFVYPTFQKVEVFQGQAAVIHATKAQPYSIITTLK